MVILATELTITWNKIQGVNDTKSVGQLIPLMIGVGGIGHVVLAVIRGPKTVDEVMQEYYQEDSYNMMVMGASASNGREE
jgi:Trk-type K+ transport system membrane component